MGMKCVTIWVKKVFFKVNFPFHKDSHEIVTFFSGIGQAQHMSHLPRVSCAFLHSRSPAPQQAHPGWPTAQTQQLYTSDFPPLRYSCDLLQPADNFWQSCCWTTALHLTALQFIVLTHCNPLYCSLLHSWDYFSRYLLAHILFSSAHHPSQFHNSLTNILCKHCKYTFNAIIWTAWKLNTLGHWTDSCKSLANKSFSSGNSPLVTHLSMSQHSMDKYVQQLVLFRQNPCQFYRLHVKTDRYLNVHCTNVHLLKYALPNGVLQGNIVRDSWAW